MEAVLYCIAENNQEAALAGGIKVSAKELYERGYDLVLHKTQRAKEIYEEIITGFEDYECENYKDTVTKGMPAFFAGYDPKFNPKDHLLTLDYPLIAKKPKQEGVDLILWYIKGIQKEQRLMNHFHPAAVKNLMRRIL